MTPNAVIGLVIFLMMMVLIFIGCPVFISLLASSFVGFLWISGGNPAMMLSKFTATPFDLAANYDYAVFPMFMLVGALAGETGIAGGAFRSMHAWLGRVRGGQLFTVIAANAIFGACSGSSVAGDVVFGKLAMPELEAAGYSRKYSLGCITASGALSTLIPPSMAIIMFCMISPVPMNVGTALMCGIGPGLFTALCLAGTVLLISLFSKGSIPPGGGPKVPMVEKLKSLTLLIPIFCLFGLIIGGTFAGWFTATVGGAIGAVAVTLYAFAKRVTVRRLLWNIWDSACMEAGIFPIIIAGQLFGSFVSATHLADDLAKIIAGIQAPPFLIFCLVLLLYIFCGCCMDVVSIIIITVPVVFPILTALGYSPYVLVITLCFVCEIAGLTPPIGMNVFATSNALRIKPSEIFAGVVPYFVCEIVVVLIIALFPQICLALPTLLNAAGI